MTAPDPTSPTSPLATQLRYRRDRARRRHRLVTATAAAVGACAMVSAAVVTVVALSSVPGSEVGRLLPMTRTVSSHLPGSGGTGSGDGDLGGGSVDVGDMDLPAVARLEPDLRAVVESATRDAREDDGIRLRITSGWRSKAFQRRLLAEAVEKYGSYREARRWVNTPEASTHVTGDAVDVGPTDAAYWMSQHGSAYGLCQVHANEIWHYELIVEPGGTCPPAD